MYNRQLFTEIQAPTVSELISHLSKLPQDAQIVICSDNRCYIHVEADGTVVNLDAEDLEDCYEDIVSEM